MPNFGVPTVEEVKKRRWVVFVFAIIENTMFAAPLFGWASLRQMLMSFGWKSDACIEGCKSFEKSMMVPGNGTLAPDNTNMTNPSGCNTAYFHNYSRIDWYDEASNIDRTGEMEWTMSCNKQNEVLNFYFTIGTSCLSGSTMVYGLIMDRYGCRYLRLLGMGAFAFSCLCFSIASMSPRDFGWIVLPAVLCNGMGGILYIFTGFQMANLFPGGRSTVCALLIGSYNASALVYPILYELFRQGLSFNGCMMLHGSIAVLTLIEAWFNTPLEPITEASSQTKEEKYTPQDDIPSFMSVLFSIPCILSLVTMCITVLRLSMYIGQMNLWFQNAAHINGIDEEVEVKSLVEHNVMVFGFIQILCIVWAYPIGKVLDRKLDDCKKNPDPLLSADNREEIQLLEKDAVNDSSTKTYERVQKLRNTRDAYFITVGCLLVFGILIILQGNIKLQIITFVLHTVIRTFIHSSAAGIYVNVFHISHIGKLTGLGSIAGAIFSLIMDPLLRLVQGPLEGNPYKLNVVVLISSLTAGLLPCYLHWFANKTEKDYKNVEKLKNNY